MISLKSITVGLFRTVSEISDDIDRKTQTTTPVIGLFNIPVECTLRIL